MQQVPNTSSCRSVTTGGGWAAVTCTGGRRGRPNPEPPSAWEGERHISHAEDCLKRGVGGLDCRRGHLKDGQPPSDRAPPLGAPAPQRGRRWSWSSSNANGGFGDRSVVTTANERHGRCGQLPLTFRTIKPTPGPALPTFYIDIPVCPAAAIRQDGLYRRKGERPELFRPLCGLPAFVFTPHRPPSSSKTDRSRQSLARLPSPGRPARS